MADQKLFVRHVHTGEIKQVTEEERANQNKNYWVRITGDVKVTNPDTEPPSTDGEQPDPKTTPKAAAKATPPKE